MTESEARGFIQGKLNCMERCDRFDCKNTDECDNCEYCYSQGTFGEQTKAFQLAINALEKQMTDGCVGCAFEDVEEWEMPCRKCKRGCNDYWRAKRKE